MTTKAGIEIQITPEKDDRGRRVFAWRCGDKGGYSATREDAVNDASIVCDATPAAHTPTPWRVFAKTSILSNDSCISKMHESERISLDEREANAAFIVRAVNSHAELLAALQKCFENLCEMGCLCDENGATSETKHNDGCMLGIVQSALEKAGAK